MNIRFLLLLFASWMKPNEATDDVDLAVLEDYPARLMKKGGIVAPSTYIEEPIVVDKIDYDELPGRLQKNLGPITKKITARGTSSFNVLEEEGSAGEIKFSLIAWKFAGGTIKGHIIGELDSGESFQANVDCLSVKDNIAIVGGVVSTVPRDFKDALNSRAYVKVVDNEVDMNEISSLTVGWSDETDCESHRYQSVLVNGGPGTVENQVQICSRRHSNWDECTAATFKTTDSYIE